MMRTKSCLFLSLLMCLAVAGCSEDGGGTAPSNNGGADASLTDAGDATADSGGEDASEDASSGDCTADDDCNVSVRQTSFLSA
jgi:hypothetical protein